MSDIFTKTSIDFLSSTD